MGISNRQQSNQTISLNSLRFSFSFQLFEIDTINQYGGFSLDGRFYCVFIL